MAERKKDKNIFVVRQQDHSDCGIACILTILKYHGGSETVETLRQFSGTSNIGTTMLGLMQCAHKIGFRANGFLADFPELVTIKVPIILHVFVQNRYQHYVVLYPAKNAIDNINRFLIGDPANGVIEINKRDLELIWQSKSILVLNPNSDFITRGAENKLKWKWFWSILKPDKKILVTASLLGIVITALSFATAVFSQKLIDNIIPSNNKTYFIINIIGFFFILILRAGSAYIRQHLTLIQNKNFSDRIVTSFFENLIKLPKSFFDNRKVGDMLTRMNDSSRIQKNVSYITGSILIDLLILFATATFLINYSTTISLITFIFIPIIIFAVLKFSIPIKNQQRNVMVTSAINESNYIDIIQGVNIIKGFNEEKRFTKLVSNVYSILQDKIISLGKTNNRLSLILDITGITLSVCVISASALLVMQKQLKIGEMMAIISLTGTLIPAVSRLTQNNIQLQEAKVAFDRMYEFTSIKPEYEEREISSINFEKLMVNNISFRFAGRKQILEDISFEVKKGEMIAILGESGCGKSTIISILQKFYPTENGNISINDIPLSTIYTPSWRNIVAAVPQEIKIFNGTILDNIAIGDTNSESAAIIGFCEEMGLNIFFEKLPQGYFTVIGEDGINLSGGQKQLVGLSRALYRNPQVLLLDEATSAMDRNTELYILELLKKLQNDIAIVLITHKIQTAKIANRVYIIEDGRIQAKGTPKELLNSDNFFSQLIADAII